jgi:hypothetical protein
MVKGNELRCRSNGNRCDGGGGSMLMRGCRTFAREIAWLWLGSLRLEGDKSRRRKRTTAPQAPRGRAVVSVNMSACQHIPRQ